MVETRRGDFMGTPIRCGSHSGWQRFQIGAVIVIGVFATSVGCQMGTPRILPTPLTHDEQRTALLEIVPLGTAREVAVENLSEAGVEGRFGISDSVYYCDVWQRDEKTRWHIDMTLLFDDSGQLYEIRPVGTVVDVESGSPDSSPNVDTSTSEIERQADEESVIISPDTYLGEPASTPQ